MKPFVSFILLTIFLLTSCSPAQLAPTQTPSPTSTFTPRPTATITPTATVTPTATPIPMRLVFEEDFVSDVLGWKSIHWGETFLSYGEDGLELRTPRSWPWYWIRPINIIEINGDFDFEVVFDRRVKLSGVWFASETLDWSDWFVVAINQGAFSEQNWEHEKASLGVLTLSQPRTFGDWRQLGNRDIEELINRV